MGDSADALKVNWFSIEMFDVLKCGGYRLEHNFGHGKDTLASVLVVLNLLAFAYHTVASLAVAAWNAAVAAKGATYRFSSTGGPSRHTWCSRIGRIGSTRSERAPYDRPEPGEPTPARSQT